ncbi:Serine/arginine-rich splicing factor SR45a [Linum perenne]
MEISKATTIPGMDVSFPGKELQETINFQGQCSSISTEGLVFDRGEEAQMKIENSSGVDTMQLDTKQDGDQELSSPPHTIENEIQGSSAELDHEEKVVLSPSKVNHCQPEMDELDGNLSKPSSESLEKTSCSGGDAQVSSYAHKSLLTGSEIDIGPKSDPTITTPPAEDVKELFQEEKSDQQDSEHMEKKLTNDSGRTDMSPQPERVILLPSSEMPESPSIDTLSKNEDVHEKSCLSLSGGENKDSLPRESGAHKDGQAVSPGMSGKDKEVGSQHMSSSTTRIPTSPIRSSRHNHSSSMKRRSGSPNVHKSPDKKRRREHCRSRSPIAQRDSSSGLRRDPRGRSRSRSPHARDHQLRSSRTRHYSPPRRSPHPPDLGHHPNRHSPLRRSWAPPPNRRTGFGKPGNNLFIAGFSFLTTERDLERKFSRFGRVRDVRIVRDRRSGDSRGFGFLSLERDEEADAAIRALDETEWNGRIILVEKSKSH